MGNESFVLHTIFLIFLAYLADLVFGDPAWFPHPIRGIGRFIIFLEKRLRRGGSRKREKAEGILLFFLVVGISSFLSFIALNFLTRWNDLLGDFLWVYLGYVVLATKDLGIEAKDVFKELESGSLVGARQKLS